MKSASKRALRRTQAHAALLRLLCGWDADAIIVALDYGEPIKHDRLYKWVERGRAPVLAGLARWRRGAESGDHERVGRIADVIEELMNERRADAGRARPSRRTSEDR